MSHERSSQEMKALFHEAARAESAPPAAWVLAQARQGRSRLPYLLAPLAVAAGFVVTLVLLSGGPGSDSVRPLSPVPVADASGRPLAAPAGGGAPVSAPSSLVEKAKTAIAEARYEDAALLLDKAQAETPDAPEVLRLRAMLFQLTGKVNEACEAMGQFVAAAPEMAAAKHFTTFMKAQNAARYPACGEGARGQKAPQDSAKKDPTLAENKDEETPSKSPSDKDGLAVPNTFTKDPKAVLTKDKDGLSIPSVFQESPSKKKTAEAKAAPGKPTTLQDSDKDTVPDVSDGCPFQAGKPVNDGCPPSKTAQVEEKDTDRDGIPDASDKCPNDTSNRCKEVEESSTEKDSDRDGILDGLDKCPTDKTNNCAAAQEATLSYKEQIDRAREDYAKKDYPSALKALDEANKKKPGDVEVLRLRSLIYQSQGNPDKACASMKKYIASSGATNATSIKFVSYMDSQDHTANPSCKR